MSSVFTIIIYGETEMTSGQKKGNKGIDMSTMDKKSGMALQMFEQRCTIQACVCGKSGREVTRCQKSAVLVCTDVT